MNIANTARYRIDWKKTENNADALESTGSKLLDLFGTIGALRTRTDFDIAELFTNAFEEDKLLATKMAFYARNIRGGLGERRTSRIIFKWLANNYPEIMKKNLAFVPVFGRWDDLYELVGTEVEGDVWNLIKEQFYLDLDNMYHLKGVSLLAKWLKSVNTSSNESRRLGKLTAYKFGMSEKEYRKNLSNLRRYLRVVEQKMSTGEWEEIDYESVPSRAMMIYRKAFVRHDPEGFQDYMQKVMSGQAKIHSGTLYPYDIIEKILYHYEDSDVLEEQWKALPNYVEGENNVLVMADVSGSMSGLPMATSVGLAIYFAERNRGAFANMFMTFSSNPQFVFLEGKRLYDKARNAMAADWQQNTDFEKALSKILEVAVENNVPQADMPKVLIAISDMEFDQSKMSYYYNYRTRLYEYPEKQKHTYYENMRQMYKNAGYEVPRIVFWNVSARQNTFHADMNDEGVQYASGQSVSVFKSLLKNTEYSAMNLMRETLNDPIYDVVMV